MNFEQTNFFHFIQGVIRLFSKPMRTVWDTDFDDRPCMFVCNHDSSYGPMAMFVHFELLNQSRPWINNQTLHPKLMPSYVREDFWWPRDKWYTKILDYTVAYLAAPFLPLILRGCGCIPVHHDANVVKTFSGSVEALECGYHLILFPERPAGYRVYDEKLYSGFVSLARLYYKETGKSMSFYPTFISWKDSVIKVGKPLKYDPSADYRGQAKEIITAIEEYFKTGGQSVSEVIES